MISAVDSSVILDVVTDDPDFAQWSERVLRKAAAEGQLIVCECVLADPSSRESAVQAGNHFTAYLERGGRQGRVVADFLIRGHAGIHADRLVARDRGYLRDYFPDLVMLDPRQAPDSLGE